MLPTVTIRRIVGLLAVTAVCAALVVAADPKGTSDSKKGTGSSKSVAEAKAASPLSEHEAFAEPYRTIQVATTDMGIVRQVLVREGQVVAADQPLVKLDEDLVKASLAIAQQNVESRGALKSAEAELRLHTGRLDKLETLLTSGHARPDEVEKSRSEKEIAAARVLNAQELLAVRQRELERTQIELARRTVRSPLDGVVTKVHREVGEFVAPTDPVVATIVQLDPLLATFSLPPTVAGSLRAGQPVQVQFATAEQPVKAEVEFVSSVMDARSGTLRVKVRVPNAQGQSRSGERCTLLVPSRAVAAQTDRPPSPPRAR
jgi:RND family efflux transporter MFP subunit